MQPKRSLSGIPQDAELHTHLAGLSDMDEQWTEGNSPEAIHYRADMEAGRRAAMGHPTYNKVVDAVLRNMDRYTPDEPKDTATASPDNVVLPKHYGNFAIEPVRFCIENKLDPFQFNIIKYTVRHRLKNGVEDIEKCIRYAEMYKRYLEGNPNWWTATGDAPETGT